MAAKLFIDFIGDPHSPASYGAWLFVLYFFLQFLLIAMKPTTFLQSSIQAIPTHSQSLLRSRLQEGPGLSLSSQGSLTHGRVVNLVGGDLESLVNLYIVMSQFLAGPFQSAVTIVLL